MKIRKAEFITLTCLILLIISMILAYMFLLPSSIDCTWENRTDAETVELKLDRDIFEITNSDSDGNALVYGGGLRVEDEKIILSPQYSRYVLSGVEDTWSDVFHSEDIILEYDLNENVLTLTNVNDQDENNEIIDILKDAQVFLKSAN